MDTFSTTIENAAQKIDIISRGYYLETDEQCGITLNTEDVLNSANDHSVFESDVVWNQIKGVTNFWSNDEFPDLRDCIINILSSMAKKWSIISYCIVGDGNSIRFYVGTTKQNNAGESPSQVLVNSLLAYMPGIDIQAVDNSVFEKSIRPLKEGGLITGYPRTNNVARKAGIRKLSEIDNICRGMLGNEFALMFTAIREDDARVRIAHKLNEKTMTDISKYVEEEGISVGAANVGQKRTNYLMQRYLNSLSELNAILERGEAAGIWNLTSVYAASDGITENKLHGLLKSAYHNEDSGILEPIRCIKIKNFDAHKNALLMPGIINCWMKENENRHHLRELMEQKYSTVMDSELLADFCMLPKTEMPGFYIDDFVEFDISMRSNNMSGVKIGAVCNPGRNAQNAVDNNYFIPLDDFTRHALIIGITGGGKTNTSKSLLSELYLRNNIPFLVIESAKREYIELINLKGNDTKNFDRLMLFTLGAEGKNSIKYRINPFEIASYNGKRVSLQTHIDYLLATFRASFEMYPPMPYVLETSVYEIYSDCGWDIINDINKYGKNEFPTLSDLYYKIDEVVEHLGYDREVQSNVKAALKARVNSLRIGGKGAMMDTRKSIPIEKILNSPTVMELEDLGDDDTKSFVIGLLLVQLYEFRKAAMMSGSDIKKKLTHILMIEEAHRLLKNVSSSDGGRANSVEFFCNMLAEIRTFGQGIIIADQVPTKLASDTIKNTNLKIVHRTVMEDDREAMGHAMNMTPEQVGYLSSLSRGVAAVYAEGDNRPKLVRMPLMEDRENNFTRDELIQKIRLNVYEKLGEYDVKTNKYFGCIFCPNYMNCNSISAKTVSKYDLLSVNAKNAINGHMQKKDNVYSIVLGINKSLMDNNNESLSADEQYCMACKIMNEHDFNEDMHIRIARNISKRIRDKEARL